MNKILIRTAAAFLAAVLLCSVQARAISAEKAIVLDGKTGRVLYEKCADQKSLVASTTKIMTALIICQQCNVLDRMQIPKEAVGIEGSSMYLQEGEVLTLQELLYGLMLSSGNDAAVALAIYCGGTVEGFAQLMNDKARRLGMKNTHFANPHGLDAPDHYSTARDLALLAGYAMENPIFAKTVSTKAVTVGNRRLTNHNKLLWQVEGADGVKTGYTKAAGRILVSSASRQGRRLICVTINDGNDWADHKKLLEDGFSKFHQERIVEVGQRLGTLAVFGGEKEWVDVVSAEAFDYPLAQGERVTFVLSAKGLAYAPVVAGSDAGFAYICVDGKAVGKVAVSFEETIEQPARPKRPFWQRWLGDKQ